MKRYSREQINEIVNFYNLHNMRKTTEKYHISDSTLYSWIDPIFKQKQKERVKKWTTGVGKQRHNEHHRKYHSKHPEYDLLHKQKYLKNNIKAEQKRIREKKYHILKMKTDINYRLRKILRNRISSAVIKRGYTKSQKTIDLIGCTVEFLKEYLQKLFKPGMSWDNYGEWHIDHIIPCASFNLENLDEQKKCFNFLNLQPLWAVENLKKHDNI